MLFCYLDLWYFEIILRCCENAEKKKQILILNLLPFLKLYVCVC